VVVAVPGAVGKKSSVMVVCLGGRGQVVCGVLMLLMYVVVSLFGGRCKKDPWLGCAFKRKGFLGLNGLAGLVAS
jgi:hypothetical protein